MLFVIMPAKDPRVDAYIAKSATFAKPILKHVRLTVHENCPEVEETIKWGMPSFMYKGILCGMAAFKEHCSFGFWKASLILDKNGKPADAGMGSFGKLRSVKDLPSKKILAAYVRKAMELNDKGVKPPARTKPKQHVPLVVPADVKAALKKNKKAAATFANFSYSHQKEYLQWFTEAKQAETRKRRLAQAIEWMAEGKPRNWKYQNC
jgi:uncharacterized protein YdeI (YjbR/CyaY-like superfamily)